MNLIQQQLYDYPANSTVGYTGNPVQANNSAPFRTYNFTYLASSGYTSIYIRNRMTLATVTGPTGATSTVYLASNTYDGTTLGALLDPTQNNGNSLPSNQPTPILHDSAYGASLTYRGNPTSTWQMGTTTNTAYLTTGVPYQVQDGDGMTVNVSTDGSTANSLPSVLTPNSNANLSTSMSYNSSFGITSVTGANGATQSALYDVFNRPNTITSVDGAVTTYEYTFAPNTQTATISTTVNSATTTQWKTTTFDGFGRPIRVQTGHDVGVAVANVDTQYGACGCSPLGKMTKTSMPYAPGATVYWTTNTYDSSGRTLTQTKPDNSVTTTSYAGNAVTVTDPAGKWKTYYSDMAGGLTTVVEPNPGNATNPVTYYYLNGAGQITQVSVQRNGVAQNRTFAWSGSDMTSSTTPEAGTVTYAYDGNHHVLTRTDAKSQQTKYTYDTYERLIETQHYTATGFNGSLQEQTNQQVGYGYDVNPLDPGDYLNSWGRLTQVTFQEQTVNGNSFAYVYSYNQAGRVTANTLLASNGSNLLTNLKATYTWDNQGRMTNLTYPSGTALAYQYDSMGRLSGMTSPNYPSNPNPLNPIATATYTAASQLNTLQYGVNGGFSESRGYNNLMQLIQLTSIGSGSVNMHYTYTAGQNNGRVLSTTDGVLGETVSYTYDMWNRLTQATASNGSWGEAYAFDGFGNLTGKTPTAGSAPAMNSPADPTTNRPSGASYDANGNPPPANNWDIENRLVMSTVNSATTNYTYDPWGRRMWKEVPGGRDSNGNPLPSPCETYFYGATGQKLESYSCRDNGTAGSTLEGINIYFGGKLLQAKGVWVATDKLGSVRANSNGESFSYFPYGEERTSTADGREKFATYTRDGFGQDYAEQRYYNANMGAFWTPDPGGIKTAKPTNPSSWNRYAYTKGNPIGRFDPRGLEDCDPDDDDGCYCDDDPDGDGCTCSDDGSECDSGGGDGPGPQQPGKKKKAPGVRKGYGGTPVPCNGTANQLMSAIENNFASFGDFSGVFAGGAAWGDVDFSPPAGQLQAGESIGIQISAGTTVPDGVGFPISSLATSVTVTTASATQLAFATVPGHLLYPATISFAATDLGNGNIGFSISIQGNLANLLKAAQFYLGGSSFEDAQWAGFLGAVAAWCGQTH